MSDTSYRSIKWDQFKDEYQDYMGGRTPTGRDVEEMNDALVKIILEFAREHNLFKKSRTFFVHKPWVKKGVRDKKEIFEKALHDCKITGFSEEGAILAYRLARADLVKSLRERRKLYFDSKTEAIVEARSSREFWSSINFFRKKGKPNPDAIMLEEWVRFYSDIFPVRQNLNVEIREIFIPLLDQRFTLKELDASIKRAKLNKSPGEDGISVEYFKNLNLEWKTHLLKLFNSILHEEVTPERWANIIVIMLYKKELVENV